MLGSGVPLTARFAIAFAVVAIVAVVLESSLRADDERRTLCASATAQTAAVDAAAARRIYAGELHGRELRTDARRVERSRALLDALASGSPLAVRAAVHELVYTPHWHIVRLRVTREGRAIADVGGPSVIAPVTGALRRHGHLLGRYVMSVQDDAGFVKLVTRFIGAPIDLYRSGSYLMGTLRPAPALTRNGTEVSVAGRNYLLDLLQMRAFPSGRLRVALLIPAASPGSSATSCGAVRVAAWGAIAKHLAARFKPLSPHYQDLVDVLRSTTGGFAFVRSGAQRLAGGAGPVRLPTSGQVSYRGGRWSVYSWQPAPAARVYLLTPAG